MQFSEGNFSVGNSLLRSKSSESLAFTFSYLVSRSISFGKFVNSVVLLVGWTISFGKFVGWLICFRKFVSLAVLLVDWTIYFGKLVGWSIFFGKFLSSKVLLIGRAISFSKLVGWSISFFSPVVLLVGWKISTLYLYYMGHIKRRSKTKFIIRLGYHPKVIRKSKQRNLIYEQSYIK